MKIIFAALVAMVLAGCSAGSSRTLIVQGEPEAIARFVNSGRDLLGEASVAYRPGDRQATFSSLAQDAQAELMRRASAEKFDVIESRSAGWSFGSFTFSETRVSGPREPSTAPAS